MRSSAKYQILRIMKTIEVANNVIELTSKNELSQVIGEVVSGKLRHEFQGSHPN